ncbi:hypothetical protein [Ilumatobacter nonamiensis]|uniref:hypothetical protein n=1 Tax=Ilumatobacter nonamiensis TaxID=467093 RepID=UPI00034CEEC0|nr:hypothetical protein [Ilumatobacter nonamiensis]
MNEPPSERNEEVHERWNADENPAVEGDQFLFVAAVNFVVRQYRKLRAKLRR